MIKGNWRTTPVRNGDPEWRSVTTGMTSDVFDWLNGEARRRGLTNSELVRYFLIEKFSADARPA